MPERLSTQSGNSDERWVLCAADRALLGNKSGATRLGHPGCRATLKAWLAATLGWTLTISKHWWTGLRGVWVAPGQQPPEIPRGFHVLKRRWVVERTFAWVGRNRRMSRDYERLIKTGEMLLYAFMARVTLRRLAIAAQ